MKARNKSTVQTSLLHLRLFLLLRSLHRRDPSVPSMRKQLALRHERLVIPIQRARTDDHIASHLRIGHVPDTQTTPAVAAEGALESVARLDFRFISKDLDVLGARVDFVLL